jgi:type I restriction enzyme S subunit
VKELPPGWESAKIADVADVNPQLDADLSFDVPVSFIPMASVEAETGGVDLSQTKLYGELRSKSYRHFRDGDVLFAKITPCMENGKAAVAGGLTNGRGFGSTEFHVLRPPSGINPHYLLYYLLQKTFRRDAARNMKGTAGQLRVPAEYLRVHPIPTPPSGEQDRIVAAIEEQFSRLDSGVVALERARQNLKRMRAAVLDAAVTGKLIPCDNTLWDRRLLQTLGVLDRGRSRHRPRNDPALYGGPYPFIQTGDVGTGRPWIIRHTQSYNAAGLAQSRLWPRGTLCITIAANIARTGLLAFEACFPDSVVGFVASDGVVVTRWVELVIRSLRERLERAAPATAQKNINLAVLRSIEIPYPNVEYQSAVLEEYDRQMSTIDAVEAILIHCSNNSDSFYAAILASAFSGELVPQDPSDEPASVLLERIAVERASTNGRRPRTRRSGQETLV